MRTRQQQQSTTEAEFEDKAATAEAATASEVTCKEKAATEEAGATIEFEEKAETAEAGRSSSRPLLTQVLFKVASLSHVIFLSTGTCSEFRTFFSLQKWCCTAANQECLQLLGCNSLTKKYRYCAFE